MTLSFVFCVEVAGVALQMLVVLHIASDWDRPMEMPTWVFGSAVRLQGWLCQATGQQGSEANCRV